MEYRRNRAAQRDAFLERLVTGLPAVGQHPEGITEVIEGSLLTPAHQQLQQARELPTFNFAIAQRTSRGRPQAAPKAASASTTTPICLIKCPFKLNKTTVSSHNEAEQSA